MKKPVERDTLVVTAGRHPRDNFGVVNPPVYHASTITFPTMEEFETRDGMPYGGPQYGRTGTPTTFAFEEAMTVLHGGHKSIAFPSGLAAIAGTLTGLLQSGDHLLMVDTAYGPTRIRVSDWLLRRAGVDITYYDPTIGAGIADLIRPQTKVVYMESPGSQTFEMQDVPAISKATRDAGAVSVMDNTWSSPYLCQPLSLGADIVVEAATKYVVGHADAMLGFVTVATEDHYQVLKNAANSIGFHAAPDDCYLALRGLRTLAVRLERHQINALKVAQWLQSRDEVVRVMYPALANDPGHALWQRDHSGACGLFGVVLAEAPKTAVAAMLDNLEHFSMGASWGGFESLVIPTYPAKGRTATEWRETGPSLRFHIGLEEPGDLIADLDEGLQRFNAAR
jgi:cystathionine beta-lyase